jgi:hypothetical protein
VKVILFGFDILYLNGEVAMLPSTLTISLYCSFHLKKDGICYTRTLPKLKESSVLQNIRILIASKRFKPSLKKVSRTRVKD